MGEGPDRGRDPRRTSQSEEAPRVDDFLRRETLRLHQKTVKGNFVTVVEDIDNP